MENLTEAFSMLMSMDKELLQIIVVTLRMSFFSTLISCLVGMPMGVLLGKGSFKGKGTIIKLTGTFMGLPPVVAGLIVYMLFSKNGIFRLTRSSFHSRSYGNCTVYAHNSRCDKSYPFHYIR